MKPPQGVKVLVLGGDGFCGWPAALQLSADGHQVWIADNLRNAWGVLQLARLMKQVPWAQSPHYRRFCRADLEGEPVAQGLLTRN